MTPALYLFTLLAGLTLGWQGCLAATAFVGQRRQATQGRGTPTASPSAPALEIDLRDKSSGGSATPVAGGHAQGVSFHPGPIRPGPPATTTPYDWRTDPTIAQCQACHGRGRMWTIDGRAVRCPCGARPAPKAVAR